MDFKNMLYRAKEGSRDAQEELTRLYHPLLVREAIVDGIFDEESCIRNSARPCSTASRNLISKVREWASALPGPIPPF